MSERAEKDAIAAHPAPFFGFDPAAIVGLAYLHAPAPTKLLLRYATVKWDRVFGPVLIVPDYMRSLTQEQAEDCCSRVVTAMRALANSHLDHMWCHIESRKDMEAS